MTTISQVPTARQNPAVAAAGPVLKVDGKALDTPSLDKGLVLSLACAEGNTNADGSLRNLGPSATVPTGYPAQGHLDPGDHKWNKGRLSYAPERHGLPANTSVAECERRALDLVRNQMAGIESRVQQLGMSPANPNYRLVVASLMDSVNQTGSACFEGKHSLWNELPQAIRELNQGRDPLQTMADCRSRSHARDDGSCGSFNGSWAETRADQKRRVGEIHDCLKRHGGLGPVTGGGAQPPAPTGAPRPTTGSSPAPGTPGRDGFRPTPVTHRPTPDGVASTGMLGVGARGPEVSSLQERLNLAGAQPPLEVDGQFGANTEQAVRDFQRRNNLAPDGVVGDLTRQALDRSAGVLGYGTEGAPVRQLQEKLNQAGAQPPLDVDGQYGEQTEQAVLAFQKRHGLDLDGVAGPHTQRKLDEVLRGTPAPTPATPAPKPSQGTQGPDGDIRLGSRGPQVERLKKALTDAGFYHGAINNEMGAQGIEALKKAKQALNLGGPADVAGDFTLKKLEEYARTQGQTQGQAAGGVSGLIKPIRQQDATSCGLTSVAMMANAANAKAGTGARPINDQDLRAENGGGTGYLPNVLNRHLQGTGFHGTDESWSGNSWNLIEQSLKAGNPVMVSTNGEFSASGYGHYITLTKMEGDRIQYADPADGQMKWTTRATLDAQPPHSDGRWFSRLVRE
jgi:peptidoglycan hydrolase-like protein with peptidoglycan-binding domain